jgi:branched-chain amino acid transport system substrate-binding protein
VSSSTGAAKRALIGTPTGGPQADTWDNPKWQEWVKAYQAAFAADKRFQSPSLTGTNYYNATNALFTALNTVNGDLSDGHKKLRATLSAMVIDAPNGKIRLDDKRQAIAANFVTEVVEAPNGDLANKMVKFIPEVRQTLGFDDGAFAKLGLPSRTNPECKAKY